jgi:hypothetical protein
MVNAVIELNAWPDVSAGQATNKYVSLSRAREEEFTDGVAPCAQHRSSGPTIETLRAGSSCALVLERC